MRIYDATLPDGLFEINGSRTESFTDTEFVGHIEFICDWDYRDYYANILHNKVYPKTLPALDDGTYDTSYYQSYYPAVVQSIQVSTMGAEGITVQLGADENHLHYQAYSTAKLSVEYRGIARPSNWTVQESVTPTYSMRRLPSWGFYWRSDGSPVLDNETPAVQELMVDINRTLTGVRQVPWWFYGLGGKTNINAWTDLFTGESYMPDTLLFIPSNMQRQVTYKRDDDDNIWTIGFTLKWNPIGWNSSRRPHGVDMMMRQGNPVFLYGKARFPNLLIAPEDSLLSSAYRVRIEWNDASEHLLEVDPWGNVSWVSWDDPAERDYSGGRPVSRPMIPPIML